MKAKRIFLFDIDGTLLLTGGAGKEAFNIVFQELFQIENVWQNVIPDGRTDPNIIQELFQRHFQRKANPQELKRIDQAYIETMEKTLNKAANFRLMPGMPGLIEKIAEKNLGYLGIATGNYEATARMKLKKAGLNDYFAFGGFASDSAIRFELTQHGYRQGIEHIGSRIQPEDTFVIGDTIHDINCGKKLGAITVAVATGSTPFEELKEHRPDFLFESFENLENSLTAFI